MYQTITGESLSRLGRRGVLMFLAVAQYVMMSLVSTSHIVAFVVSFRAVWGNLTDEKALKYVRGLDADGGSIRNPTSCIKRQSYMWS